MNKLFWLVCGLLLAVCVALWISVHLGLLAFQGKIVAQSRVEMLTRQHTDDTDRIDRLRADSTDLALQLRAFVHPSPTAHAVPDSLINAARRGAARPAGQGGQTRVRELLAADSVASDRRH